jgi:hypothetical protein
MKKSLILIAIIAVLFAACADSNKKQTDQKEDQQEITVKEPVKVSINEFINNAGDVVGEEIVIEGLVNHVCKHGGKRMFLIDTATQETVKIVVGEGMASFNTDLEGQDVIVKGTVDELRIDEAYLLEWEAELENEEGHEGHEGDGHGEGELGEATDQGEHIAAYEQIAKYREQLKDSEKDHLSFYSIVCNEYEVK